MKYFLDTEFIEYPYTIDLISIGIVCEDGREYYAENEQCDFSKQDDWGKANVTPNLKGGEYLRTKAQMVDEIRCFITEKPEFWGYYSDYDWVVFCWLFGKMIDLPKGWPMYCRDLKQYIDSIGNPRLPKNENDNHNALEDARHLKKCFDSVYMVGNKD